MQHFPMEHSITSPLIESENKSYLKKYRRPLYAGFVFVSLVLIGLYFTFSNIGKDQFENVPFNSNAIIEEDVLNDIEHNSAMNDILLENENENLENDELTAMNGPRMTRLFRCFNPGISDYLYTISLNEVRRVCRRSITGTGYGYPILAGWVWIRGDRSLSIIPFYRYFNTLRNKHFYTTNFNLLRRGSRVFRYRGITGYIMKNGAFRSRVTSTYRRFVVPFYKLLNEASRSQFFSINTAEVMNLWRNGYRFQGIEGYISTRFIPPNAISPSPGSRTTTRRPIRTTTTRRPTTTTTTRRPITTPRNNIVVRREISDLSVSEQRRFANALRTMMRSRSGVPGSSEYNRLAAIHGGNGVPGSRGFCAHSRQSFPTWHRIYVVEFERALQAADINNGGDGNIALPYWGWEDPTKQNLPSFIFTEFRVLPSDLFPRGSRISNELVRVRRNLIPTFISQRNVISDLQMSFRNAEHFRFASGYSNRPPSFEQPHGSIHVAVGGSNGHMTEPTQAAYDPIFWLHHCNVDRLYQRYIVIEPDSEREFRNDDWNEYNSPLRPFTKRSGANYMNSDCYDITSLKYRYDSLPNLGRTRAEINNDINNINNEEEDEMNNDIINVRPKPNYAVFSELPKRTKSMSIFVYVIPKNMITTFDYYYVPQYGRDIRNPRHPSFKFFGGSRDFFGESHKFDLDLPIDISNALKRLKISRYEAELRYFTEIYPNPTDKLINNNFYVNPTIKGALFEDSKSVLSEDESSKSKANVVTLGDTKNLQTYLKRYGLYVGLIDGIFGPKTKQALLELKSTMDPKFIKIVDAVLGPKTKHFIEHQKRCGNIDGFGRNDIIDKASKMPLEIKQRYLTKKNIYYFVGIEPGYLNRNKVLNVIKKAFDEWMKYISLKFILTENENNADIVIWWEKSRTDYSSKTGKLKKDRRDRFGINVLEFDGPGGVFAHGGIGYVVLDADERWSCDKFSDLNNVRTWYRASPLLSLPYAILHELGHCLGLDHSKAWNDVMSPYYNPKLLLLSPNDIKRVSKIFPKQYIN